MGKIWDLIKDLLKPVPDYTCPHCGHYYMMDGPPHNDTACEVAKLRKDLHDRRYALVVRLVHEGSKRGV